jgi:hypothetical protein
MSDNAMVREPLTNFSIFMELPVELRFKIYQFACWNFGPNVIKILAREQGKGKRFSDKHSCWYRIPPLLATSTDSRHGCSVWYKQAFADQLQGIPVWFNFETDTLYFENFNVLHCWAWRGKCAVEWTEKFKDSAKKVRKVIVGGSYFWRSTIFYLALYDFHSLETLVFTKNGHEQQTNETLLADWKRLPRRDQPYPPDHVKVPEILVISKQELDEMIVSPKNSASNTYFSDSFQGTVPRKPPKRRHAQLRGFPCLKHMFRTVMKFIANPRQNL